MSSGTKRIVCVREGRAGYHVGDTVDVPEDVTVIDLTYFSSIDSEHSQIVLKNVGKDPEGNPLPKNEEDNENDTGGTDANEDGGE